MVTPNPATGAKNSSMAFLSRSASTSKSWLAPTSWDAFFLGAGDDEPPALRPCLSSIVVFLLAGRRSCRCGDLRAPWRRRQRLRSEEHTSELQSRGHLVCRLLLEKKKSSSILNLIVSDIMR